jgi:hypothetical protein
MAKNTRMANPTVNVQADALARHLDNGYLRIYSGTQPTNADDAITSQVLLAELRFAATSAFAAVNGVLTFNAVTSDDAANATGTATWFRCLRSDGTTIVMDGTVGNIGSNSNLELATTAIVENARISVTSFIHTVAKSTAGA